MNRKEAIDKLVEAVEDRDYGTVLSFDEIGRIIGKRYMEPGFNDVLQAARKRLVTAGHMIVNVRGIGYKVCNPYDYTGESVHYMRLGARRIDMGARVMRHAPVNDMSLQARQTYNRVNDRMATLQAAIAGASVEIHMLDSGKQNPLLAATK